MQPIQQVVDESGAIHSLTKRIGAGGQGEVWLTEGGRRVVKLLSRQRDPEALRRQFIFVRRLDLSGLHVARPLAVLKPPHVGYVAEFLADTTPIKTLLEAPRSDRMRWYIETGGLRRRLRLLAHAAEALAGLHARGVIYADVSHQNIFVSAPVDATEAWLIDLDNLSHDSDIRRAIYTPGYGAPEVVAGEAGCTSLSDTWGFAVLAWQTLTLTHPFVGDLVNDGEPELEEQAFAGKLPWVGHSSDHRNACSDGLPPDLVLGDRLMKLARETFELGRSNRAARASVTKWAESLHEAADITIKCAECAGTYFASAPACPWCDSPKASGSLVQLYRWQPDEGPERARLVPGFARPARLPLTSEGLLLPRRITQGLNGLPGREAHVEIRLVQRGIHVRALPGFDAWVAPVAGPQREPQSASGRGRIVPQSGWMVFFEEPNKPQRVAVLGGGA